MREEKRMFEKKWVIFSVIAGVFLGFAILLATQEALHATDTGEFCSSCHIMSEVHESYSGSAHVGVTCNDCHIPQDNWFRKYTFKARAGITDVYYNTLGKEDIPSVLHPNDRTKVAVNENCIRCHKGTNSRVGHDVKEKCTTCHRGTPHGIGEFKSPSMYEKKKVEVPKVTNF
ncbi:MAG: nitrate/TMAO reductase rane-bound tetraheme cytochrome c subunit-like protein [Bacillales bacterium]|jgi:cytochrome c nitrite reductase small subunit|nr:nitrate/TMAO reductase rane-bound tetraheme cytochrome c subunit-like protein [Bacillales bacterium]